TIQGDTSSQYISALLLIAPSLPKGLTLTLNGKVVSRPYIEMTIRLMEHFGAQVSWEGDTITVSAVPYTGGSLRIEADWSAASYYYSMVACTPDSVLTLDGLNAESLQGDSVLVDMMRSFGVESTFTEEGVRIENLRPVDEIDFIWDFIRCPDLAQTLAVTCAMTGRRGLFTGLETLRIKETDRILALQNELAKVQVRMEEASAPIDERNWFSVDGTANLDTQPKFETYEDHRMAMAFAPLAILGSIKIEEPMVVRKSYPHFYEDLEKLGFQVKR
ncbi:MAG: 3-phosphoshikimate 1-carboxyvinyltransferase, partial [Bacteroidota bacterium]